MQNEPLIIWMTHLNLSPLPYKTVGVNRRGGQWDVSVVNLNQQDTVEINTTRNIGNWRATTEKIPFLGRVRDSLKLWHYYTFDEPGEYLISATKKLLAVGKWNKDYSVNKEIKVIVLDKKIQDDMNWFKKLYSLARTGTRRQRDLNCDVLSSQKCEVSVSYQMDLLEEVENSQLYDMCLYRLTQALKEKHTDRRVVNMSIETLNLYHQDIIKYTDWRRKNEDVNGYDYLHHERIANRGYYDKYWLIEMAVHVLKNASPDLVKEVFDNSDREGLEFTVLYEIVQKF